METKELITASEAQWLSNREQPTLMQVVRESDLKDYFAEHVYIPFIVYCDKDVNEYTKEDAVNRICRLIRETALHGGRHISIRVIDKMSADSYKNVFVQLRFNVNYEPIEQINELGKVKNTPPEYYVYIAW